MNVAVETVGDAWSLLVVRDIVFYGKSTFGEFLAADERITTSVLADRLAALTQEGILTKSRAVDDRRKEHYKLTEKGLALIPILVEMANWGVSYGPQVTANPQWVNAVRTNPQGLNARIRATVEAGGAVWRGDDSVIRQLQQAAQSPVPEPDKGLSP